jgi:hypothetical protein
MQGAELFLVQGRALFEFVDFCPRSKEVRRSMHRQDNIPQLSLIITNRVFRGQKLRSIPHPRITITGPGGLFHLFLPRRLLPKRVVHPLRGYIRLDRRLRRQFFGRQSEQRRA